MSKIGKSVETENRLVFSYGWRGFGRKYGRGDYGRGDYGRGLGGNMAGVTFGGVMKIF